MTPERRAAERLFHRDLPGGGYVAIDVADRERAPAERAVRVVVERRCDRERRQGHRPPIIREERWGAESSFGDLYRLASDNAAIARELMGLRAD
jgi:hypothetical protein